MTLPYALRDILTEHPIRSATDDELWAFLELLKNATADVRHEQERRRINRSME